MGGSLHIKILIAFILLLILHLQYRLWFGDGSVQQIQTYQNQLKGLQQEAQIRKDRNQKLYAQLLELRKGQEAIEEIARHDLGMIKKDETFFQVIE